MNLKNLKAKVKKNLQTPSKEWQANVAKDMTLKGYRVVKKTNKKLMDMSQKFLNAYYSKRK